MNDKSREAHVYVTSRSIRGRGDVTKCAHKHDSPMRARRAGPMHPANKRIITYSTVSTK